MPLKNCHKQKKPHEVIFIFEVVVRVKIIIGSLVILENLFPPNHSYRYRLEIRMNSFNDHYRFRLGVRSHPFISIGSQLPSWKAFEWTFQDYRYRYRLEMF